MDKKGLSILITGLIDHIHSKYKIIYQTKGNCKSILLRFSQ